ncbi:MAG: methionyl-tRNA formyltransferase [Candidatus Sericytochromatia bacterium]|nr:methionyl-tRNA formyltransferase [Candidatus Sericytochromatia bacterium]
MARLVFMGTPQFAVPALKGLLEAGHEVLAVVTQPDRPSGRGQKLVACPVKLQALESGIEILQPERLRRDEDTKFRLAGLGADAFIVVAYGQILPAEVLAMPRKGCLNIHGSLLPRHRGAAPVARAILAGDEVTGVSLMRLDEGMDTGPVVAEARTSIGRGETAGELATRLSRLGAELLVRELGPWLEGLRPEAAQDEASATLAPKLEKAEGWLDWHLPADILERRVRGVSPWPGARTRIGADEVKIHAVSVGPEVPPGTEPGVVLAMGPSGWQVACGEGSLMLEEVQWPGRKSMAAVDAARGFPELVPGTRLE